MGQSMVERIVGKSEDGFEDALCSIGMALEVKMICDAVLDAIAGLAKAPIQRMAFCMGHYNAMYALIYPYL